MQRPKEAISLATMRRNARQNNNQDPGSERID